MLKLCWTPPAQRYYEEDGPPHETSPTIILLQAAAVKHLERQVMTSSYREQRQKCGNFVGDALGLEDNGTNYNIITISIVIMFI